MKSKHLYNNYQLGKLSRLPFSGCENSSTSIFDKIHFYLWGPTLVLSLQKFKYYACLVNEFSKYTWIILLQ